MNYLAHIILSGKNKELLYGNFIGDGVKGKAYLEYENDIRKGILLHRYIDYFTDTHPVYLKSKRRFYGKVNKLSGVITDILYDFLLWKNWKEHYSISPSTFIDNAYVVLDQKKSEMPDKIRMMYYYMRKNDWLNSYRNISGIEKAISGISNRVGVPLEISMFQSVFIEYSNQFNDDFNEFYRDIKVGVDEFLSQY